MVFLLTQLCSNFKNALKAGCNCSASFCGSTAIILLKENPMLIIFDFTFMRVKWQIDMDNSEIALVLQITCFGTEMNEGVNIKARQEFLYVCDPLCRNDWFWCSSEGGGSWKITCMPGSAPGLWNQRWVRVHLGPGKSFPTTPVSRTNVFSYPGIILRGKNLIWLVLKHI